MIFNYMSKNKKCKIKSDITIMTKLSFTFNICISVLFIILNKLFIHKIGCIIWRFCDILMLFALNSCQCNLSEP
jgi:hypothetical protein